MNKTLLKLARKDLKFRKRLIASLQTKALKERVNCQFNKLRIVDAGHSIQVIGEFILGVETFPFVFIVSFDGDRGIIIERAMGVSRFEKHLFEEFLHQNQGELGEYLFEKVMDGI